MLEISFRLGAIIGGYQITTLNVVRARHHGMKHECLCIGCGVKVLRQKRQIIRNKVGCFDCSAKALATIHRADPSKYTIPSAINGIPQPTYRSWYSAKSAGNLPECWLSYPAFVDAMGERPVGTKFRRRDPHKRHGPGNSYWAVKQEVRS